MGSGASKESQGGSAPASTSATTKTPVATSNNAATATTSTSAGSNPASSSLSPKGNEQPARRQQESVKATSKAAQERVKKARDIVGGNDKESDEFHNACMVVFQNADINGDGMLDRGEFWNVLHSKSLNLNLSDEEKAEFLRMAGVDQDGRISYKEFVPIVKRLLQRVYQKKNVDWNDWCWVSS